ncbi:hypothetical protein [Streptomyces melanogenes]|nr:hypothetical protein [Streptomyces melanogenes]
MLATSAGVLFLLGSSAVLSARRGSGRGHGPEQPLAVAVTTATEPPNL